MINDLVFFTGLEPAEVRYAQDEFKKFDMDVSGKW